MADFVRTTVHWMIDGNPDKRPLLHHLLADP